MDERENTDYNAVIKQFDDLISELSNSGQLKDSLKQSDNLIDIIKETSNKDAKSKKGCFGTSVGSVKNSSSDSKYNQKKLYLFETDKHNILSTNETKSDGNIHISKDEPLKVDSYNPINHSAIKRQLPNAVETVPWIDSQLWHAESKTDANSPQKSALYKMKQNLPFVNDLIHPKENGPLIVNSIKNIPDHGSLGCFKSYPIPSVDHPSRYSSSKYNIKHLPSLPHSEAHMKCSVYSPSFAFQREKTVKANFWIPGASVEKSPRLTRSSASKYISSEKCFWVNLFIETKNSHLGPFTFEIYSRMSLRLLKLKVEKEYGIVSSSQRWILGRNFAVDNDKSLVNYNVMPGSSIILYVDSKCSSSTKRDEFSMKNVPVSNNSETNIVYKDKGTNLSDSQAIKFMHSEAGVYNKKQNFDLNSETSNNTLSTSRCHDLLNEREESGKSFYASMPNAIESPSVRKKNFNRALKSKKTHERYDVMHNTSEINAAHGDKDTKVSAIQDNKFMYNRVEVCSRKNSSDLKNPELNYETGCINALRVSCHGLVSESEATNPTVYYDCVSDVIQSPSVTKENSNRAFQSKEAECKVYGGENLNIGESGAEFGNIDFEQNCNIEKNADNLVSTETTLVDKDVSYTSSSSQMEPFIETCSMLATTAHAEDVLQNKVPRVVLKNEVFNLLHAAPYPAKSNSSSYESNDVNLTHLSKTVLSNNFFEINDKSNFQSLIVPEILENKKEVFSQNEQTHETEYINSYDDDSSAVELKHLNHLYKTENVGQSDLTSDEQSDNLHSESSVQCTSKTFNSKKSRTSFLKKLCLARKTQSTEDPITDSSTSVGVNTTNITDNKLCDDSTSHADQSTFTDVHIEISQDFNLVSTENEYTGQYGDDSQVEGVIPDPETIKNFELLQEIESMDLVQNSTHFTCPVCFDDFDSGQGAVLHDCLHVFCRECLINSVIHANGALVKCPYRDDFYSCESHLQQREIKALVSEEVYERYLQRSIITAEGLAERSFHCRTPNCPGWCIYEDVVNVFHCPVCFHYNCLNCQAIHEGLNCRQYQDKLKVQQKVDQDAEKTLELLNKMIESGKALKCPKCNLILMKRWGCDWLKCSICQTEICWVTKGPRWGPGGQGDTSGGCRCGVKGIKCHPTCNYCH